MKRITSGSRIRAERKLAPGDRRGTDMPPVYKALVVLLALSLLAASCGGQPKKAGVKPDPVVAVVVGQLGGLQVRPAGKEVWLAGGLFMPLYERDMLMTAAGANLLLSFPDGQAAMVGQDSVIRISGGDDYPRLEMTRGELRVDAGENAKTFAVETPAAGSDAKGAVFDLKVSPGGVTLLGVVRGTVSFTSDGERGVRVKASEQSEASPGLAPGAPVKVTAPSTEALAGGYGSLVELQTDRYFAYEESRDSAEAEARSRIAVDPLDAWAHVNLGRALLDIAVNAEARAEFVKAIEVNPQFAQALSGLGKVELVEGRWTQAAEAYGKARRADSGSLEAVFGLGLAALGAGDTEDAGRWFKDALDVDAQDARSWAALGFTKLLESDVDAALADFESAIEIDPDLSRAYLGRGLVYSLRRNRSRAVRELESAAGSGKADARVLQCLGLRSFREGKPGEAAAYFRRLEDAEDPAAKAAGFENAGAVALSSGDARGAVTDLRKSVDLLPVAGAFYDLANTHLALREGDAALAAIGSAQACDPGGWYGYELLARSYIQTGAPVQAAGAARRALELNPSAWVSRVVLGLALASAGARAEAEAELSTALRSAPGDAATASERGFVAAAYQGVEDYDRALAEYREASRLAPRDGSYHRFAGDVLIAMKRESEALEEYRKAVELNPADVDAYLGTASILRSRGDKEEAAEELLRAVERDPDNAALRIALAEYMLADGDADGALVHLEAARAATGVPPGVLAEVLFLEGNARDSEEEFQLAIDAYALALAQDAGRGDAWFYTAGDLERTGRPVEARAAYQKALELCRARPEWQKFYTESAARLNQLK